MRRGDESNIIPKSTQDRFQTPNKPPLPGSSSTSKARKGISTARKQSGAPASSGSTSKSWKRSSLSIDQPTLTQIDFVTPRSQNPESDSDGDLEYIDDVPQNDTPDGRQVIEIDDDSNGDASHQPASHTRTRRTGGAKLGLNAERSSSGLRRSLGQPGAEKRLRGRKSTDGVTGSMKRNGTDKRRKDKTLTQMDYVRRYLKIEPDDEVKLEYTYITPKKSDSRKPEGEIPRGVEPAYHSAPGTSGSSKKRKLEDEEVSKETVIHPQMLGKKPLNEGPKTPQKPRRSEVPSSQSPESPGIAFISSSQFRNAIRSPLKLVSSNTFHHDIKEESPGSNQEEGNAKEEAVIEDTIPNSLLSLELPLDDEVPFDAKATQLKPATETTTPALETKENHGPNRPPPSTERTVVYETDAETDYSDDEQSIVCGTRCELDLTQDGDPAVEDENESPDNDSQELPLPIIHSGSEDEPSILQPETNLSSDASICYQRRQPATQFPLEPIPTLNTQKLAELFPQESNLQQIMADTHTPRAKLSLLKDQALSDPSLQTQTQSQTQDLERESTEIVPESSPVVQHGDYAGADSPMLPEHPAQGVVQVESSQLVDRINRQADLVQDSCPKGVLRRSQLLTSSVMESVPVPGFWMGSQDSVGEPYSLPDT